MTEEKFICNRGKLKISGSIIIPSGMGPFPLVIYSHGFGYAYEEISMKRLAENGIAACRFDFCGGAGDSRSSGSMLQMSVMTEAEDLKTVLDFLKKDERFNKNRIFLSGNSQGGYVSTIVGIQRKSEIAGLFLLCPAFVIADFKEQYMGGKIPKLPFSFGGMLVGPRYVSDIDKYPIFQHMKEYEKPVVIYHGTKDNLAPIAYSKRAIQLFPNAILNELPGAGHLLSSHSSVIEADMISKIINV